MAALAASIGVEEALPVVASAAPLLLSILKELPKKLGKHADEILPKIEENLEKLGLIVGHIRDLHDNVKDVIGDTNKKLEAEADKVMMANAKGANESVEGILKSVYSEVGKKNMVAMCEQLDKVVAAFQVAKKMTNVSKVTPSNFKAVSAEVLKELDNMIDKLTNKDVKVNDFCRDFEKALTEKFGFTVFDANEKMIDKLRMLGAYLSASMMHIAAPTMKMWLDTIEKYKGLLIVIESLNKLMKGEWVKGIKDEPTRIIITGALKNIGGALQLVATGMYNSMVMNLSTADKRVVDTVLENMKVGAKLFGGPFPEKKEALLVTLIQIKDVWSWVAILNNFAKTMGVSQTQIMDAVEGGKKGLTKLYGQMKSDNLKGMIEDQNIMETLERITIILGSNQSFKELVKKHMNLKTITAASGVKYVDDEGNLINQVRTEEKLLMNVLIDKGLKVMAQRNKLYSLFTKNSAALLKENTDNESLALLREIVSSIPPQLDTFDMYQLLGLRNTQRGLEFLEQYVTWEIKVKNKMKSIQTKISNSKEPQNILFAISETIAKLAMEMVEGIRDTRELTKKLTADLVVRARGNNPTVHDFVRELCGSEAQLGLGVDLLKKRVDALDGVEAEQVNRELEDQIVAGGEPETVQFAFAMGLLQVRSKTELGTVVRAKGITKDDAKMRESLIANMLKDSKELSTAVYSQKSAFSALDAVVEGRTALKGLDLIIDSKKTQEEKMELTRELFSGLIKEFTAAHTALVGEDADTIFTPDAAENAKVHTHLKTKLGMVEGVLKELNGICNGIGYIEDAIRNSKAIPIKDNVEQWKTNFGELKSKDLGETINTDAKLDELTKLYSNLSGIFDGVKTFDAFRTDFHTANRCPSGYNFYNTADVKKLESTFGEYMVNSGVWESIFTVYEQIIFLSTGVKSVLNANPVFNKAGILTMLQKAMMCLNTTPIPYIVNTMVGEAIATNIFGNQAHDTAVRNGTVVQTNLINWRPVMKEMAERGGSIESTNYENQLIKVANILFKVLYALVSYAQFAILKNFAGIDPKLDSIMIFTGAMGDKGDELKQLYMASEGPRPEAFKFYLLAASFVKYTVTIITKTNYTQDDTKILAVHPRADEGPAYNMLSIIKGLSFDGADYHGLDVTDENFTARLDDIVRVTNQWLNVNTVAGDPPEKMTKALDLFATDLRNALHGTIAMFSKVDLTALIAYANENLDVESMVRVDFKNQAVSAVPLVDLSGVAEQSTTNTLGAKNKVRVTYEEDTYSKIQKMVEIFVSMASKVHDPLIDQKITLADNFYRQKTTSEERMNYISEVIAGRTIFEVTTDTGKSVQLFDSLVKVPIEMARQIIRQPVMCLATLRRGAVVGVGRRYWAADNTDNPQNTEMFADELLTEPDPIFFEQGGVGDDADDFIIIKDTNEANECTGAVVTLRSRFSNYEWFNEGKQATKCLGALFQGKFLNGCQMLVPRVYGDRLLTGSQKLEQGGGPPIITTDATTYTPIIQRLFQPVDDWAGQLATNANPEFHIKDIIRSTGASSAMMYETLRLLAITKNNGDIDIISYVNPADGTDTINNAATLAFGANIPIIQLKAKNLGQLAETIKDHTDSLTNLLTATLPHSITQKALTGSNSMDAIKTMIKECNNPTPEANFSITEFMQLVNTIHDYILKPPTFNLQVGSAWFTSAEPNQSSAYGKWFYTNEAAHALWVNKAEQLPTINLLGVLYINAFTDISALAREDVTLNKRNYELAKDVSDCELYNTIQSLAKLVHMENEFNAISNIFFRNTNLNSGYYAELNRVIVAMIGICFDNSQQEIFGELINLISVVIEKLSEKKYNNPHEHILGLKVEGEVFPSSPIDVAVKTILEIVNRIKTNTFRNTGWQVLDSFADIKEHRLGEISDQMTMLGERLDILKTSCDIFIRLLKTDLYAEKLHEISQPENQAITDQNDATGAALAPVIILNAEVQIPNTQMCTANLDAVKQWFATFPSTIIAAAQSLLKGVVQEYNTQFLRAPKVFHEVIRPLTLNVAINTTAPIGFMSLVAPLTTPATKTFKYNEHQTLMHGVPTFIFSKAPQRGFSPINSEYKWVDKALENNGNNPADVSTLIANVMRTPFAVANFSNFNIGDIVSNYPSPNIDTLNNDQAVTLGLAPDNNSFWQSIPEDKFFEVTYRASAPLSSSLISFFGAVEYDQSPIERSKHFINYFVDTWHLSPTSGANFKNSFELGRVNFQVGSGLSILELAEHLASGVKSTGTVYRQFIEGFLNNTTRHSMFNIPTDSRINENFGESPVINMIPGDFGLYILSGTSPGNMKILPSANTIFMNVFANKYSRIPVLGTMQDKNRPAAADNKAIVQIKVNGQFQSRVIDVRGYNISRRPISHLLNVGPMSFVYGLDAIERSVVETCRALVETGIRNSQKEISYLNDGGRVLVVPPQNWRLG